MPDDVVIHVETPGTTEVVSEVSDLTTAIENLTEQVEGVQETVEEIQEDEHTESAEDEQDECLEQLSELSENQNQVLQALEGLTRTIEELKTEVRSMSEQVTPKPSTPPNSDVVQVETPSSEVTITTTNPEKPPSESSGAGDASRSELPGPLPSESTNPPVKAKRGLRFI